MISIIICYRSQANIDVLKKNIADTIGGDYEIIAIENFSNQHSIFSAYNKGVESSQGEILCFMHEDVTMQTDDWGTLVHTHFQDPEIGMIALAGTPALPSVPCPWWYSNPVRLHVANIIELKVNDNGALNPVHLHHNPLQENATEIVAADGCWFCIRKDLFKTIRFDADRFNGFHLYDLDISLQVRTTHKVKVVFDIEVIHASTGTANREFFSNLLLFTEKWQAKLPQSTSMVNEAALKQLSFFAFRNLLLDMKVAGFSNGELKNVVERYKPLLPGKLNWNQQMFFGFAKFLGYRLSNSLFIRLERFVQSSNKIKAQS